MINGRRQHSRLRRDERGFTLPELLTTIAILGILLAIAMVVWNSIIESRRVDAAANQLTSDMRLAHTRATNQLTDWRLIYEEGEPKYFLMRLEGACDDDCENPKASDLIERELPEGTEITESLNGADPNGSGWERFDIIGLADLAVGTTSAYEPGDSSTIEFNTDGGSYSYGEVSGGPDGRLKVGSDSDSSRCWKITVLATTSRVEQAKEDGCG